MRYGRVKSGLRAKHQILGQKRLSVSVCMLTSLAHNLFSRVIFLSVYVWGVWTTREKTLGGDGAPELFTVHGRAEKLCVCVREHFKGQHRSLGGNLVALYSNTAAETLYPDDDPSGARGT